MLLSVAIEIYVNISKSPTFLGDYIVLQGTEQLKDNNNFDTLIYRYWTE